MSGPYHWPFPLLYHLPRPSHLCVFMPKTSPVFREIKMPHFSPSLIPSIKFIPLVPPFKKIVQFSLLMNGGD